MIKFLKNESWMFAIYSGLLRENRALRRFPSFFRQYRAMRPFLEKAFPFCFLRKGQCAIQVGCAEWLLDFGVSQALIMSAMVGSKGRVLVIEPDERNIDKLNRYLLKNRISNIEVLRKGAWKCPGKMRFTVYKDRSSSNVLSAGQERILSHGSTPSGYQARSNFEVEIEVDSLDKIIKSTGFSPDFVNLTINGTEFEAIQGLSQTLERNVIVAFLGTERLVWVGV